MNQLLRDTRFWIWGILLLGLLIIAVFASSIAPHPSEEMRAAKRLQGPSRESLLGTDEFGRDILSRLIYGARLTLTVSMLSVAFAAGTGTALGLVAGYGSHTAELIIMRFIDAVLSFPTIVLAIFVVVFIGPELRNVILTIAVLYMPRFARIVHGVTLAARRHDYVEAARAVGATDWRILRTAILPNVTAPTLTQMSLALGDAILLESSLSFLGLGPPPPAAAWGRIVSESTRFMHLSVHTVLWPSLAISSTVLAFNIFGDALRDALDPRLKGVF